MYSEELIKNILSAINQNEEFQWQGHLETYKDYANCVRFIEREKGYIHGAKFAEGGRDNPALAVWTKNEAELTTAGKNFLNEN